jgi:hypothetical protein
VNIWFVNIHVRLAHTNVQDLQDFHMSSMSSWDDGARNYEHIMCLSPTNQLPRTSSMNTFQKHRDGK